MWDIVRLHAPRGPIVGLEKPWAQVIFIVPAYGALASKVTRTRLINWITLFFVSNLVLFYVMGRGREQPGPTLGVTFYLWLGIFNLMVIAQFWSFANDLYSTEQGKRLFAVVGFFVRATSQVATLPSVQSAKTAFVL